MALITDKLRAIMELDPDRAEIDFAAKGYSWGHISRIVREIEALARRNGPAG
jgi:long-chain acyl-CoA synthetase